MTAEPESPPPDPTPPADRAAAVQVLLPGVDVIGQAAAAAALGLGDVPPAAFATALNLISPDGLLVFTIKDESLGDADPTGFNQLIGRMRDKRVVEPVAEHRLSARREALHSIAYIARRRGAVPASWTS